MTNEPLVVPQLLDGTWTNLVILTYGANLGFFEDRLLRQLSQIPQQVVLADSHKLAETFADAARTGRSLRRANRTYMAASVRSVAAFHPKAVLLTSETEGRLLIGSGNLGQDGYATAGELWHVFGYQSDLRKHLPRFTAVRSLIDRAGALGWIDTPAVDMLAQIWAATAWLDLHAEQIGPGEVIHNVDRRLIDAITAAVTWPVELLTVHAPFFDQDGAALCALVDALQPARLRLLLTRDTSIEPEVVRAALAARRTEVDFFELAVAAEPSTYIHAKLVHAVGATEEVAMTGSANISRAALLFPASTGNVELAVIERRPRNGFANLYTPLTLRPLHDIDDLDNSYRGSAEPTSISASSSPALEWSEIRGGQLILVFNRAVDPAMVTLSDRSGGSLVAESVTPDGTRLIYQFGQTALERVNSGNMAVAVDAGEPIPTWPYHLSELFSRKQRATDNNILARFADLPDTDVELMELLRQFEQTLIIDTATAWRLTGADRDLEPGLQDDDLVVSWQELDWPNLRAHPVYRGYLAGAGGGSLSDVQVILRSIASRLAEFDSSETGTSLGPTANLETERKPGCPMSITARTRIVIRRLVTRYLRAIRDPDFQRQLGPAVSVQNAVIFNDLITRLLALDLIEPGIGIDAHLATWTWLWGSPTESGLLRTLDAAERASMQLIIDEAQMRRTTTRALCDLAQYDFDPKLGNDVRRMVHHLLVDDLFDFTPALLREAARHHGHARRMAEALHEVATSVSVVEAVLAPWGLPSTSGHWEEQKVARPNKPDARVRVLVVTEPVAHLTVASARRGLARLATFCRITGDERSYQRIRFATGQDMCFWDATMRTGVCFINVEIADFDALPSETPAWYARLERLPRPRIPTA